MVYHECQMRIKNSRKPGTGQDARFICRIGGNNCVQLVNFNHDDDDRHTVSWQTNDDHQDENCTQVRMHKK